MRSRTSGRHVLAVALALLMSLSMFAEQADARAKRSARAADNPRYAAIVIDAKTGEMLHGANQDAPRYPASLTKMMTLYVLFEELEAGRMTLDTRLKVSQNAANQAPSKIGVRPGSTIRVEDAIKALTVKSANDVAAVVAENVSGSVPRFAERMTRTARAIGMRNSTFRNASGLPDPGQRTTARDLATLGLALQDRFPRYYKYFSSRSFSYGKANYRNHNRLIGTVEGVDGIKTGYIRASGFNLVTNVRRGDRHLVAVVMGGTTGASRDAQMRKLIAEYLPDASRGPRTAPMLVAKGGAAAEPRFVALPTPRPDAPPVGVASTAAPQIVANAAPVPAPAAADPIGARISAATEVAELAYAAEEFGSGEDPIARLAELAQSRAGVASIASPAAPPEAVETDLVAAGDGWYVQVGAVPTEKGARALLDRARGSASTTLASAEAVTQRVDRNGTTLYRARFAGFAGKDEARDACALLKRNSISCLAVPN
jgi:D-alanyl-D-alanine carboxypeptidase